MNKTSKKVQHEKKKETHEPRNKRQGGLFVAL
jgi:hypothetical protein